MLMRRYGRLPVLFWSQVLSLAFLFGNCFSPNLSTFAGKYLRSNLGYAAAHSHPQRCDVSMGSSGELYSNYFNLLDVIRSL